MTTENTNTASPQGGKPERPARRYSSKSAAAPAAAALPPVANPMEYFNNFAKTMQGSGTMLPPGGVPVEMFTDVAAKLIAWPMEQWLDALYRGYEVMRSAHDAIQGLERRVESTIAGGENRAFQGVQNLTNQSLSALGGFAQSPIRPFWMSPFLSKQRKDW